MSDACSANCSSQPSTIQPYGDIAGIGVTLAFTITAWMVVGLLILYYLAAYNPELDPFRKEDDRTLSRYPNPIDFSILRLTRRGLVLRVLQKGNLLHSNSLESAFNNCVITLSDIQIFTGISVLISGYMALNCGLSAYHWQLMVYLAWMASVTHLACLSFLRNYLMNRPDKRLWRVVLMFSVMILLAIAIGITGYFELEGDAKEPAHFAVCYLRMPMDSSTVAFESMLKMILLIIYGFFIRLAKMSRVLESQSRPAWDPRAGKGLKRLNILVIDPILIALFSLVNLHLDMFTSFLAEVYWLTFSLIWGTKRLFETRQMGPEEENEWTFGQTLPLVLLIAPLAAIIEHFFHSSESREREDRTPSHTGTVSSCRLDVEDVQDDGMVGIDHDYVDSISYQGVVCLAALAYIEAGLFFVLDNMYRGIRRPLPSFTFLFFIFNATLQMLWIDCALWISRMNWIIPLQRSSRAIILIALAVTSMTGFFSGPGDFFNESTLGNYLITYASMVATFAINACVGDSQWMSLRLLPALLQLPILYLATQNHLKRYHVKPLYCPTCSEVFETLIQRDHHIIKRSCELQDLRVPKKLNAHQQEMLTRIMKMNISHEERWNSIFTTIFPNKEPPSSPYLDSGRRLAISVAQDYFIMNGRHYVSEFLQAQGLDTTIEEDQHAQAALCQLALEDFLGCILERYRDIEDR
ncbi:hypothetical protein HYE67_002799 [Fusarium culmorum]|uniref:Uncharacterized protein n=1 Tax=Fusarium culmorum TaxID=5516 RepID=A0A7S8D257_FUSCU|nr:hypothetical protein HYE67_002799 [Fusarium culmorum]